AGARVMYAGRFKSLRAFDVELPPAHACRRQNGAGTELCTAIKMECMKTFRTFRGVDSLDNDRRYHLCAELEHLQNSARRQLISRQPVRKSNEILDSGRCARLPARAEAVQHDGRNALGCRVNR